MNLAELKSAHERKKGAIRKRLAEFGRIRKGGSGTAGSEFYELCYCILTANGSAAAGRKAQACLEKSGFWKTGIIGDCLKNVRYNGNKKKFILQNRKNILEDGLDLRGFLSGGAFSLRERIAKDGRRFKGLGWKASSQFLRNTGFRGLAILDRHILKNLKELRVIKQFPKTLTKKKYLEIERKMKNFCERIGIPIDEFDLLLWTEESGAKMEEAK
ncbi:MAG: DNA lyase [Nanoarchaeota archaeon]|nr:DNA lyase [Nanoarchaeota archaeon]